MQINLLNYKYNYEFTSENIPKEEALTIANNLANSVFNPLILKAEQGKVCYMNKEYLQHCFVTLTNNDND